MTGKIDVKHQSYYRMCASRPFEVGAIDIHRTGWRSRTGMQGRAGLTPDQASSSSSSDHGSRRTACPADLVFVASDRWNRGTL